MEWPPYSPDLNPIKEAWHILKLLIHRMRPDLNTIGRLDADKAIFNEVIKDAWTEIPIEYFKTLGDLIY
jgi:hypothetical protein